MSASFPGNAGAFAGRSERPIRPTITLGGAWVGKSGAVLSHNLATGVNGANGPQNASIDVAGPKGSPHRALRPNPSSQGLGMLDKEQIKNGIADQIETLDCA